MPWGGPGVSFLDHPSSTPRASGPGSLAPWPLKELGEAGIFPRTLSAHKGKMSLSVLGLPGPGQSKPSTESTLASALIPPCAPHSHRTEFSHVSLPWGWVGSGREGKGPQVLRTGSQQLCSPGHTVLIHRPCGRLTDQLPSSHAAPAPAF